MGQTSSICVRVDITPRDRGAGVDGSSAANRRTSELASDSPIALLAVVLKWYSYPGVSPVAVTEGTIVPMYIGVNAEAKVPSSINTVYRVSEDPPLSRQGLINRVIVVLSL